MILKPDNVSKGVLVGCVLHNLITTKKPKKLAAAANFEDHDTLENVRVVWGEELHDNSFITSKYITLTKPGRF